MVKQKSLFAIRLSAFLILLSATCASSSTLFLFTLNEFSSIFMQNLYLVLILPFFGTACIWLYRKYAQRWSTNSLSMEGVFDLQSGHSQNLGAASAILVFFSSSLSQLFGASTGREGAAVQYGASMGMMFWRLSKRWTGEETRTLFLKAGIVAGFSSLFGAPWAAVIFLYERLEFKYLSKRAILFAAVSFSSYRIAEVLGAEHTKYPPLKGLIWPIATVINFLALILAIFILAALYRMALKHLTLLWAKHLPNVYMKVFICGLLLIGLTLSIGSAKYNGLGVPLIEASFSQPASWQDPILKSVFTLLSLTGGYKGGEVTPLMSIGATAGSFLSPWLQVPLDYAAAYGCLFFFAFVLGVPLTGAVLLIEFFGPGVAPFAMSIGLFFFILRRFTSKVL